MTVETWDAFHESVQKDIQQLADGGLLAIDYGQEIEGGASPYAQVARMGSRFWCEISSKTFLPGDSWPLHGDLLRSAGWSPPSTDFPNWSSQWSSANAATAAVIHGLRYGWGCTNPVFLAWHTATLPQQKGFVHRFLALFRRKHRL